MPKFFDSETQQDLTSPEAIASARAAGTLMVDNSGDITVADNRGGNRRSLTGVQDPGAALASMLDQGYQLESDEMAHQQALQMEARSAPIQAGAEALVDGATLGLSTAVGSAISDDYAEGAQARREQLGGVGTLLNIAGGVIPGLASGGAGLVGRAAAMTPAGIVARTAATQGARLEAALAARGVSAGVAKIAGMGVEGALDGAVSNVGATLSEASLGDTELTAEQLVAAGGIGALLGGFGGAATGAVANKVGSKIRQIADKYQPVVPGSVADEVAPGIAPRAAVAEAIEEAGAKDAGYFRHIPDAVKQRVAARVGPENQGLIDDVFNDQSLRRDILNETDVVARTNQEVRESLDEAVNTGHLMRDIGAGGQKVENLRTTIRTDTGEQALGDVQQAVLRPFRQQIEDLTSQGLIGKAERQRLTAELDRVEAKVERGFVGGQSDAVTRRGTGEVIKRPADPAEAYYALDRYKATLGDIVARESQATGSGVVKEKAAKLQAVAEDTRNNLQKYLEREDLFGTAGTNQRERNQLWAKAINSGRMFNDQLTDVTGRGLDDGNWWVKERYTKGDKVDRFLQKLTDPNAATEVEVTREHMQALSDLYSTIRKNGEIPDAQIETFTRAEAGLQRAMKALDDGGTRLRKIGQFNAIADAEKQATGFGSSLPVLGGIVGGAPGAALGTAANVALQPVGMLKRAMQLEAMANHIRGQKQSVAAQTKLAITRLAKPPEKRSRLALSKAATAYFGRDRSSSRERAKKLETRLSEYRANPQRLSDALSYQSREIAEFAPGVTANTALTTQRGLQFLDSKLPPMRKSNNTLQPQLNQRLWTDADVDKMMRYTRAVTEPDSVLKDLEAGQLTPEAIEAVKAVYPKKFQEMQIEAAEVLATQQDELPHSAAIQLALLFDVPGVPTMSPAFQKTFRAMREQTAQKTQQQAIGGNPSPAAETPQVKANTNFADQLGQGLESP